MPGVGDVPAARPHARRRVRRSLRQGGQAPRARLSRRPDIERLARSADDSRGGVQGRAHQGRPGAISRSAGSRPRCCTTCGARASPRWPTPRTSPDEVRNLVASFQRAVVDALVRGPSCGRRKSMTRRALAGHGRGRRQLATAGGGRPGGRSRSVLPVFIPPVALSTDNAAMIGAAGYVNFRERCRRRLRPGRGAASSSRPGGRGAASS